jgi:glucan-binding YG repeat protein
MKFDMKKRILALALAGTTAFSVFGAAMSANAYDSQYTTNSTHVVYTNDTYKSYTAVTKIVADNETVTTNEPVYSFQNSTGKTIYTYNSSAKANSDGVYYWREVVSGANNSTTLGSVVLDGNTIVALSLPYAAYATGKSVDDYSDVAVGTWVLETKTVYETGDTTTIVNGNTTTTDVTVYTTTAPTVTSVGNGMIRADGSFAEKGAAKGTMTYRPAGSNASNTWNLTLTDIMDVTVVPGTVYLYDYYYANAAMRDFSSISTANGNEAKLAALLDPTSETDGVTYDPETGLGSLYAGERYDVVNEWVEFLNDLSINQDNGYHETQDEFISGYTNMYYGDPCYSAETGKLIGYDYVDLYNIDTLLKDIYALSTKAAYKEANTSTLIYLMQQYDKYVNNYFDQDEISTDEWGDLLVNLLQAATEDDFKGGLKDYKKYVNKVDDLVDAYENATSTTQVEKAEEEMYALLTSTPIYTAATVSKSELISTLGSLYFNVKTLPSTYNTDATVSGTGVAAYGLTGTTYTLYPMADYYEYGNTSYVYAGNTGTKSYTSTYSTDEYEWFYNVYELAYKMNAKNKYQGSVDAINEALEEAIAALSVTTTPAGSNTLALEEMVDKYAGKIESDYLATYYGYYTLANDFADVAEGAAQTRNATNMVKEAGATLGYQGAQVTVTKNDIKTLKAAISDANKALTAIKADANYSAAQVNALNKAIAAAQDLVDLYNGSYSNSKSAQSVNANYSTLVGDKDQMVKSDLDNAIAGIESAINYSEVVMGWNQTANGWTYGTEDGYVESGWKQINSVWYYFENGVALQSTWKQIDGKWYYLNSNCGAAYGWAKVDGSWYYFGGDNAMKTGWVKVDGSWYYLNAGGKMVTGWAEVNGTWYYFSKESNALGQMLANTTTPDGYTVDANGALVD